ncbi:MAG: ATP-binding cassette domain-containing protein [Deltaproteobacteria bacterium]|nr:ATP-binding cassette domain-containing protein [Deltaproteobacteria bacterium]
MAKETDAASDPDALALDAVTKRFRSGRHKVTAVKEVSARVKAGVVTGLIGPDGAGKTTLMRLIAGLLLPDSGTIHVLGMDVKQEALRVQAAIGYMPQHFGLYEDLSVQENLDLYADLQGAPRTERPARYETLMKMTGLGRFTKRLAGRLSGGMKQKLGLACTLVKPPALLLLDEPTVGVDPVSRRELWEIVYHLVEEEGMSVLLSTAYLDEAERCQEVLLLHEGTALGQDAPSVFSSRLQNQTFFLTSRSLRRRKIQKAFHGKPGVLDAVISGDGVRLVMGTPLQPEAVAALMEASREVGGQDLSARASTSKPRGPSPEPAVTVTPTPPRFEDAFIALLTAHVDEKGGSQPADDPKMAAGIPTGPDRDGDVIVVEEVERRFGEFVAVNKINFRVRHGEIFGLLGANGAGKSTTFRMLCGLLPPSGGRLTVAGVDLRTAPAHARARIGYMAQKFSLYSGLNVTQNLRFFSSAYGLWGKRQKDRIDWAMASFGLGPVADRASGDLALGFKKRLALAAALMHEPDILFLDEPTSGVDPIARREFWQRIGQLAEANVTVLVTTHFMDEAEYCDRLVIMAQGEILGEGTPSQIKERYRSPDLPDPSLEDAFIAMIASGEEAVRDAA